MRIDVEDTPNWQGGFDYCRRMCDHGFYPDEPLEVYRDGKYCYVIKSFIEGSKWCVDGERFRKYRQRPGRAH